MSLKSGIAMARNVRLEILRRTREILSDKDNWTTSYLRYKDDHGKARYCLVGAMERAAYDLGIAKEQEGNSFDDSEWLDDGEGPLGYRLANDISIDTYVSETYRGRYEKAFNVNDAEGYEAAMQLLDSYIVEVEAGRIREPQATDE